MKCRLLTLVICMVAAAMPVLTAAETRTPIVDITIANGARLLDHWHASPYYKVWSSPALASLRGKLDEQIPNFQQEVGFDPIAIIGALVSAHLQIFAIADHLDKDGDPQPDFLLQIDAGAMSETILKALSGKIPAATVAGADEAIQLPDGGPIIARFGSVLVIGPATMPLAVQAIPAGEHDLAIRFDGESLAQALKKVAAADAAKQGDAAKQAKDAKQFDAVIRILKPYLVPGHADIDLATDGFHTQFAFQTTLSWLVPVDQGWLHHLPATAFTCSGFALDGQALWNDLIHPLIGVAAADGGKTAEQVEAEFNATIHKAGFDPGIADLVSGVKGTIFMVNTPGVPFPGFTIGIPRSPGLDALVAFALKQIQNDAPAEGQSTSLMIPNLPLPITLINSASAWVVSTDPTFSGSWAAAANNDWTATPLGTLAKGKLEPTACMFSFSYTATELRTLQGYVGMGLAAAPLQPAEKQAVLNGLNQIIGLAGLSYSVTRQQDKLLSGESQGLLALGSSSPAVVAIIAAIAIPNLLESRVASNEAAAASSLKSGVFPAEVQFQAGNYHDRDKDGIGDFGFFGEMSGGPIAGKPDSPKLALLPAGWNAANPVVNGYRFAVFIPDGHGGALSADQDHDIVGGTPADSPETAFVAYAWPEKHGNGRRAFAITTGGVIFATTFKSGDAPPVWNTLFGLKGWKDPVVWQPYQRGAPRRPAPTARPAPAPLATPGASNF